MNHIHDLLSNRVLIGGVLSWFAAQLLKAIFAAVNHKTFDLSRLLFGLGGMPSSHSAVVSCMATSVGLIKGFGSVEFAISTLMAFIVMTDATGVRQAAGKQAALLNKIVQEMFNEGTFPTYEKLKELLGHTPIEVIVGALLGILIGIASAKF